MVQAYGGYGVPVRGHYLKHDGPTRLKKGIGVAVAHIRGGGEVGLQWHQQAMGPNRPKSLEDGVAVARDLLAQGIAPPGAIGFVGGTNGRLGGGEPSDRAAADMAIPAAFRMMHLRSSSLDRGQKPSSSPRMYHRERGRWLVMNPAQDARFWDRPFRKYARSKISDQAGNERTLERTRDLMGPDDKLLELDCGTGPTALRLAGSVRSYVAMSRPRKLVGFARVAT